MNDIRNCEARSGTLSLGMDVSSGVNAGGSDGNSAVVLNLAQALAEVANDCGVEFHVYARRGSTVPGLSAEAIRPIPILPMCSAEHRQIRYGLAARLSLQPPDVFLNIASGYQPRLRRGRQISIVHDVAFDIDEWKHYYTPQLYQFLHDNTAVAVGQADALVAVSQNTAADVQRIYGVPGERVRVIHSGYDQDRFSPEPDEHDRAIRERLGDGPFFVAVGTIQPRKNYDRLIRAFVRFREAGGQGYRLVIAGAEGWMSEATVILAREHDKDGVVVWGPAGAREIPALLRCATALVFPALYEGFGIPLVEAMACGTPVLASNSGPVPEITGGAAMLFDPRCEQELTEQLRTIASRDDIRRDMKRKSLVRAKSFSWRKAACEYAALARELFSS